MTIAVPFWLVIAVVVAMLALILIAVLNFLAWGGMAIENQQLRERAKVLQIDITDLGGLLRPRRDRWSNGDQARIEADRQFRDGRR